MLGSCVNLQIRPESERFLRLLEILGEWYEKGKVSSSSRLWSQESVTMLVVKQGCPWLGLVVGVSQNGTTYKADDHRVYCYEFYINSVRFGWGIAATCSQVLRMRRSSRGRQNFGQPEHLGISYPLPFATRIGRVVLAVLGVVYIRVFTL